MESKSYSVSVSQIVTKNMVLSGQYEVITDEGWLNSPYRSVRFFIGTDAQGSQPEKYPNTRSSNAASIRAKYFLPWRAAVDGMYRFYTDTWGVIGHTGRARLRASAGYQVTPAATGSSKDGCATTRRPPRTSTPTSSRAPTTATSWRATRNSPPTTPSRRASGHLRIQDRALPWLSKGQINLRYDYMTISYDDFRDATYSLGKFGVLPMNRWRRAPSPCTS
jgi:hypothetical protein